MRDFALYGVNGRLPGRLRVKQSKITRRWFYSLTGSAGDLLFIPTLRGGRWAGFPSPFMAYRAASTRLSVFRIKVEEFGK